jgi:rod shape-determining protein MreC
MPALPSETPEFFPRGPSPLLRLTVFGLLSLALMFTDIRYRYLEDVRRVVSTALAPLQSVAMLPGQALESASDYFVGQRRLLAENDALRRHLLDQAAAAQGYESLRQENERLRRLLGLHGGLPGEAIGAEVLYSGRDPFSQKLVIDKGEAGGVQTGMAVIDEVGVLGQVTRVYPTLAEVTLITDKDHLVPVQIQRSGVRTVLYGSGAGRAPELRFLPPNADVKVGDRLVTSGIDGIYQAGLAVADVLAIDRDTTRVFPRVTCQPLAGVDRSRQVMLLSLTPPEPRPAEPVEADAPRRGSRGGRRG